jgi:hypothetical protein
VYDIMDIIISRLNVYSKRMRRSSMVERPTVNRMVVGSSPAAAAIYKEKRQ